MTTRWRALVLLLVLPPVLAEMLTGSSPPARFFHPVGTPVLVLLYGGGALLIREARARWGLQWSLALLGIAYGVLEEGLMIHSFFNHNHVDIHELSRYGAFLGVQWPWTLMVTFVHATISTVIPITIVETTWPELRSSPLLKQRGIVLLSVGLALVTVFFWVVVLRQQVGHPDPYRPDPLVLLNTAAVIAGLVLLAWWFRGSRVVTKVVPLAPPVVVGVLCFLAQVLNLLVPHAMANLGAPGVAAVAVQVVGAGVVLLFVVFQLCHRDLTTRHVTAAVIGSLLPFVIGSLFQELGCTDNQDPTLGMSVVGALTLLLLLVWRRRVVRVA
jgi:hypothetical protein